MSNPVFKDIRKTLEVALPSFPDSKVVLWEQLLTYQTREVEQAVTAYDAGLITLKHLVKEWNFVDEQGNQLPVTVENLGRFPTEDTTFLIGKMIEIQQDINDKKKVNSKELLNPLLQIK